MMMVMMMNDIQDECWSVIILYPFDSSTHSIALHLDSIKLDPYIPDSDNINPRWSVQQDREEWDPIRAFDG